MIIITFPMNIMTWVIMRLLYTNTNPNVSIKVVDHNYDNGVYYMEKSSPQDEAKDVMNRYHCIIISSSSSSSSSSLS